MILLVPVWQVSPENGVKWQHLLSSVWFVVNLFCLQKVEFPPRWLRTEGKSCECKIVCHLTRLITFSVVRVTTQSMSADICHDNTRAMWSSSTWAKWAIYKYKNNNVQAGSFWQIHQSDTVWSEARIFEMEHFSIQERPPFHSNDGHDVTGTFPKVSESGVAICSEHNLRGPDASSSFSLFRAAIRPSTDDIYNDITILTQRTHPGIRTPENSSVLLRDNRKFRCGFLRRPAHQETPMSRGDAFSANITIKICLHMQVTMSSWVTMDHPSQSRHGMFFGHISWGDALSLLLFLTSAKTEQLNPVNLFLTSYKFQETAKWTPEKFLGCLSMMHHQLHQKEATS